MKQYHLPSPATAGSTPNLGMENKNTHLRQMSSFERLSSTLAALAHSSSSSIGESGRSPSLASGSSLSLTYADSGSEDEDGDDGFDYGGERKGRRLRSKSVTSMPGSLDDMNFDQEDDGEGEEEDGDIEEGYGYEGEGEEGPENEEDAAEEAFDEDFFAAGEMNNVPFL